MKNLNAVSLNLGMSPIHGRRSIGFHEGPYARTAQIAVPNDWNISVIVEHDDDEAAKTYDERRRTIYCIAIHPEGRDLIGYKWRVGKRTSPIRLYEKDSKLIGEDLNAIDPIEIAKQISNRFEA